MIDWLQAVIEARKPDPQKPLADGYQIRLVRSIQPCKTPYKDHWGLPLWNVCDAHIKRAGTALPSNELPAGYFPTEYLAREWLAYVKQPDHPKTSFSRPDDPSFGKPK